MRARVLVGLLLATAAVVVPSTPSAAAPAAKKYGNCTALQHDYPHGVARPGGADKVKGRTKAVTTFVVDGAVYGANKRLDRDKDGVACERR